MTTWGERWWGASGIGTVILFLVGFMLIGDTGDTPAEELAFFEDNRARALIAFLAFALAAFFYVWFTAALRNVLALAEAEPRPWTALGFGAGLVTAALLVVGAAPIAAAGDATAERGAATAESVSTLTSLAYPLLTIGIGMSALLALAAGLVTLRTAVLPRWFGWASVVAAPLILLAVLFLPIFVFLGWVLAASIVLLMRPSSTLVGGTTALPPEGGVSRAP